MEKNAAMPTVDAGVYWCVPDDSPSNHHHQSQKFCGGLVRCPWHHHLKNTDSTKSSYGGFQTGSRCNSFVIKKESHYWNCLCYRLTINVWINYLPQNRWWNLAHSVYPNGTHHLYLHNCRWYRRRSHQQSHWYPAGNWDRRSHRSKSHQLSDYWTTAVKNRRWNPEH